MNAQRLTHKINWLTCSGLLTVAGLRRSVVYRPLSILIAALLLPVLPRAESGGAPPRPFEAAAQQVDATAETAGCSVLLNTIVRDNCRNGVPLVPALFKLETDAVNAYLAEHNMSPADAHLIYDYGRSDLRNAIRGNMAAILIGIINKPADERTAHEEALHTFFTNLIHQNEISLYTNALNEFRRWQTDPCHFTLEAATASSYNLTYRPWHFCNPVQTLLVGNPPVPAESYFMAYGLRQSYATPADRFTEFPRLVADTGINVGAVAGIATAAGAVLASAITAPIAVNLAAALAAFNATWGAGSSYGSSVFILSGSKISSMGFAATVAAPVAIILIAIAIGITAGMQVYSNDQTLKNLNNLSNALNHTVNTATDLKALVSDSTGLGTYKLYMSLVSRTVGEVASTTALPAHTSADPNFAVQDPSGSSVVTSTLEYTDWFGNIWSAQTWRDWFVQTCAGSTCDQRDSINGSIRYIGWDFDGWTAWRVGNKFVHIKRSPSSTDKVCPADSITGVSPGSDFSGCGTYVSTSIPLLNFRAGTNFPDFTAALPFRVSLSVLAPPAFTSPSTLPFTPGVPSTQTITATGNPTPWICPWDGSLPPDFSLNDGREPCAEGSFQLRFNGNVASPTRTYQLTLGAFNETGATVKKTFTIDVRTHLSITSPSVVEGMAGFPVNTLVTTTGNPAPTLTIDGRLPLNGLSFRDNGNGTATISGVPDQPGQFGCFAFGPCGVTASNSQGTVTQDLILKIASPPVATLASPASFNLIAGVPNGVMLFSANAITPVSWEFQRPDAAPWLRFQDLGHGAAGLFGTPPAGVSAEFTVPIKPQAEGTIGLWTLFPVKVSNIPTFTSHNAAAFVVGTYSSASISANIGSISITETLPQGLSFVDGNPAGISGIAAPGTGGQHTVTLTDDAGTEGYATQMMTLNILESPKIDSPDKATFYTGIAGSFAVATTGYPSMSDHVIPADPLPPVTAAGDGMYFTVTGLPSSLRASNLNAQGFATGTLMIQGTPSAADAGNHTVVITAQNGVGLPAQQTLTLRIASHTAPEISAGDRISSGTGAGILTENQKLVSNNGRFEAVMQVDGNFVIYAENRQPIWATGTNGVGLPPYKLAMQADGNLVLFASSGVTWATGIRGGTAPYTLIMRNDGNLVVEASSHHRIWASGTPR